ncbi:Piso0_003455 [Millerozyma farinosa CBS 7064]|uniref:Piso0_003455 protein n=1 Tax=Pichia sorbitophila (strain ATCC MYA-4447 / BCRC 22081 / CBS 7064 / NBRC 10061 / NRRL Y-12695) TaxID=559304 RepID=G8YI52_PICSO|nr:Piso0_003455 [Millerozyma farinosa CBS 7064]CCE81104.1 Piso0_003455 [Millerozyma farinosa CBS 7064]
MTASIHFIKLGKYNVAPVKIFINRLKLLENSTTVSVNERSIVTLQKINLIKLSNKDAAKLIKAIRLKLLEFIVQKCTQRDSRDSREDVFVTDFDVEEWKCQVKIQEFVALKICRMMGYASWLSEEQHSDPKESAISKDVRVLLKSPVFSFNEDKKESYRINKTSLVARIQDSIEIYVYGRPSK